MNIRTPYTYFIQHIPTGLKYYGAKYGADADPATFWQAGGYFTSSQKVKALLQEHGPDSFRAEVRMVFQNPQDALDYEYRFLSKVRALEKSDWLNRNYGGKKFRNVGPMNPLALAKQKQKRQSLEGNIKRSLALKNRPKSDITRERMAEAQRNRPSSAEDERRNKIRQKAMGRGHTAETKARLSNLVKDTKWMNNGTLSKQVRGTEIEAYKQGGWNEGRIVTIVRCPHCGLSGANHNMSRHHFDKCKARK